MYSHVYGQIPFRRQFPVTDSARKERPARRMLAAYVRLELVRKLERLATVMTHERPLVAVSETVLAQRLLLFEDLSADVALKMKVVVVRERQMFFVRGSFRKRRVAVATFQVARLYPYPTGERAVLGVLLDVSLQERVE